MTRQRVIVVAGPTASGKTASAIVLARALDGEIISADSMQVYQGLDIGTAKPSEDEKMGVVHHMLDVVPPEAAFSVASYREMALPIVEDVLKRGKCPIICGGTGLYIDALLRPMSFSETPSDAGVRVALEAEAAEDGGRDRLHARLFEVDADTAARLHVNDVRRVIRALEVFEVTGKPFSAQQSKGEDSFESLRIGIDVKRETLYARIDLRVEQMMKNGLLDEVKGLLKRIPPDAQCMQALGYKELAAHLAGQCTLKEAVARIQQRSRNYAKRQMTWFGRDPGMHWVAPLKPDDEIVEAAWRFFKPKT